MHVMASGLMAVGTSRDLLADTAILVLAGFVGFAVISKVPEHVAHAADVGHERDPRDRAARRDRRARTAREPSPFDAVVLVAAIAFGMINVVGGFLVTDRMLGMFKPERSVHRTEDGRE
jgi:NAD(P) transhydrogenase subunit alpha